MKSIVFFCLTLCVLGVSASADWTVYNLGLWTGGGGLAHYSDGRFLVADSSGYASGRVFQQAVLGKPAITPFSSAPVLREAFLGVVDGSTAVIGDSTLGKVYTFNPSNAGSSFTDIGLNLSINDGVLRDSSSMFISGYEDASVFDPTSVVSYVTLDGSVVTKIIDDISISGSSPSLAMDSSGRLYVGNVDSAEVRRFSVAQLALAIGGTPLSWLDGEFIHNFNADVRALAVDAQGQIYAGPKVYNPALDLEKDLSLPSGVFPSDFFTVSTFDANGTNYVGMLTSYPEGPLKYMFDTSENLLAVPEAETFVAIFSGVGLIWLIRRYRRLVRA